jgi:hypothetical protein
LKVEAVILPQNEIIGRGIERMRYSASTGRALPYGVRLVINRREQG